MKASKTQFGVFSIEMAFVLIGMCAALYFCFDLGYQQIRKSQLERVSYSLVSILKERTLFYGKHEVNSRAEAIKLQKIATKLLNVKNGKDVVVVIDQRVDGKKAPRLPSSSSMTCQPKQALSPSFDITLEKSGKYAPIYQVTVCQRIPAWFERVIGEDADKHDRIIQAQSSFMGR